MDLLIAKETESDSGKENLDDRHLVQRQVKKEKNQARYCLVNPQTGDEAFLAGLQDHGDDQEKMEKKIYCLPRRIL
jgi:hypothetical protein